MLAMHEECDEYSNVLKGEEGTLYNFSKWYGILNIRNALFEVTRPIIFKIIHYRKKKKNVLSKIHSVPQATKYNGHFYLVKFYLRASKISE